MNILHVISQHPESTGSGYYLQNLLRQAAIAGHRNFLVAGISGDPPPRLEGIAPEACRFVRFAKGDLDFVIPGMSDVMPYASSRFSDLPLESILLYEKAFADKIGKAVDDFPIDLVHSHHLWLVSAVTRRVLAAYPMVTSCHSTDLRQFSQCPHLQSRVLNGCRQIDRILSLSASQVDAICNLYAVPREKIDIVGTGFDDRIFTLSQKTAATPVHLLYAGKLSYAKGVDWLLRIFGRLDQRLVHLHLAGSGHGDEAWECLAAAREMEQSVTVYGELSQKELATLMQRCHIFILPSFYEGLPLVLLEALASGCRIISTNLPGCLELLENKSADLFELVKLPSMRSVDRPEAKDWEMLDGQLETAIIKMIDRVIQSPSPPREEIETFTAQSNWQAVFRKIAQSYELVRSCHRAM